MRQSLDFNEMEFRTKVRAKYLRALEEERFDQLPAHTYIKGFLRTYADALGMDGQLYVDEYNSRYVAGEDDHPLRTRRVPQQRRRRGRRESRLVVVAVTAIIIVTALVIAAWKFGGPTDPKVQGVNTLREPVARVHDLTVRATGGALVHGGADRLPHRKAALPGNAGAGPGATLRPAQALPFAAVTGERRRAGRRQARAAAEKRRAHRAGPLLTRPRAAIVVTGSELVRGERTDLNGPFYAREALSLGLQPTRVIIVGDDPAELEQALREGIQADVCLVSGGLGPTHDDRTIELVAKVDGPRVARRPATWRRRSSRSRAWSPSAFGRPYADFATGVTKQATLPEGAVSLGLAGTAPGVVLDIGSCVVVVLPGPPAELRRLWPGAVESAALQRVLARTEQPGRRVLRFYGASESAIAQALADAGGDGDGVEATICARDFEIHVDLIVEPGSEHRADELADALAVPLERYLFARDESTVQELVLDLCRSRGLTLGTAESCTGGLVAARLTAIPGSSDVFRGGIVAYANEVKENQLGVPDEILAVHGAVSAEAAEAMAHGARRAARRRCRGVGDGDRGTGGRDPDKPVGLVFFHASGPEGDEALRFELPGDREWIRARSAVAALHLVRRLLEPRDTVRRTYATDGSRRTR